MRINLIYPAQLDEQGNRILFSKGWLISLTLPYLAALFPREHDIRLFEEPVKQFDFDEPVDLVGITAMTSRATRAYQIADEYRRRGVPVIMGGFHASFMTEEALEHVDSVVVGEAEGLIETILDDLAHGNLKKIYKRDSWHSLENLPVPRYDLIDIESYICPFYPVQVARGCPNRCSFCSVTKFYGHKYRYRPMDDVIRDLEQTGPLISFVDDNLTVDKDYAFKLFERMKPLKKLWMTQMDMSFATNEKLVRAASESGCFTSYIGLESIHPQSLSSVGKKANKPEKYHDGIQILRRYQIELYISIMLGFENETDEHYKEIREFLVREKVSQISAYILTPLPGTELYEKYSKLQPDKKIPWGLFDCYHSTYQLTSMTREELEEKYWDLQKWFYSWPIIIKRLLFPFRLIILVYNWALQKKARKHVHPWRGVPPQPR